MIADGEVHGPKSFMQQKMVTPLVQPLAQTQVDWSNLYNITKSELGYSILSNGDAKGVEPSTPLAFTFALASMMDPKAEVASLYDATGLLRHLSFGFLVVADRNTILESIVETKLNATYKAIDKEREIAVISGTLAEWREAIINCSRKDKSFGTRYVFNACHLFFERAQLGMIWSLYRKVRHADGTLLLEPK